MVARGENCYAFSPEVREILSQFAAKVWVLDRSVAIFVPTTVDVNVRADTSFYVEQTRQLMGRLFGGACWVELGGLYNSPAIGMVKEDVVVVRSHMTSEALRTHLPKVLRFVGYLQRELRQETIALEIDGHMVLLQMR